MLSAFARGSACHGGSKGFDFGLSREWNGSVDQVEHQLLVYGSAPAGVGEIGACACHYPHARASSKARSGHQVGAAYSERGEITFKGQTYIRAREAREFGLLRFQRFPLLCFQHFFVGARKLRNAQVVGQATILSVAIS